MNAPHVHPGQKVIARDGAVHVVAFIAPNGTVYAHGPRGIPTPIRPVCDAWGGEPDLCTLGAPACDSRGTSIPGPARRGHVARIPSRPLPRAA
jgi:hypothetical protein